MHYLSKPMKRVIVVFCLIAILLFSLISAAYLVKPVHLTINIDQLSGAPMIPKKQFIKEEWGNKSNGFGVNKDGWLPGPMSLASDEKNHLFILDQELRRVKEYSASAELVRLIPIDSSTYEDIAVNKDGFIYLLDPVDNHLVKKINKLGEVIRVYNISASIEPISGLVLAQDQVYVEVNHKRLFSIGSEVKAKSVSFQKPKQEEGQPADYFTANARISQDGIVKAEVTGDHRLDSITIEDIAKRGAKTFSIVSVDYDKDDNIYIILDVAASEKLYNEAKDKLLGLVVGQDGRLRNKFYASNDYYTSHFRKITVSPNGVVYQLLTKPEGVEIWRWMVR